METNEATDDEFGDFEDFSTIPTKESIVVKQPFFKKRHHYVKASWIAVLLIHFLL